VRKPSAIGTRAAWIAALTELTALAAAAVAYGSSLGESLAVPCPVHQTTTIVFPEPLRQLKTQEREATPLGLTIKRTKPQLVIEVRPTTHPVKATVEFRGPTSLLRVVLETTAEGTGRELRLSAEGLVTDTEGGAPSAPTPPRETGETLEPPPVPAEVAPSPADRAEPAEREASGASAPAPSGAARSLDLDGILTAKPFAIGRREGLPGQRPMVLEDALRGEDSIWLRFRLEDGAGARIDAVWWEHGDITSYVQEPAGKDLRVVVQVPRALMNKKSRVALQVAAGPVYEFAMTPNTLTRFFKGLFE
jgi:hypothetical protein